jgi:hypothetical protein
MICVTKVAPVDTDTAVGEEHIARRVSTRRSWLTGAGALLAASAVASAKTFGASGQDGSPLPQSIWPYQAPGLQFVLEARVTIAPVIEVGDTSYGHRRIIPITGGTFHGPRLSGTVLDEGEDTQLVREDGVTEIGARYTLRTDDGVLIYVINKGIVVPPKSTGQKLAPHPALPAPAYVRTIPQLEVPRASRYEWLNQALYVGTLNPLPRSEHAVVVRFFKVT